MMNRGILNPTLYKTPVYRWGVYWNESLGLISISADDTNRITIADKNLWASEAYVYGEEKSETNCWRYYQFANCSWTPFDRDPYISWGLIDLTRIWPYYYDDTWYGRPRILWFSPKNTNLWWGMSMNFPYNLYVAQWPCPEWFHVPYYNPSSYDEFRAIINCMSAHGVSDLESLWQYLFLPPNWYCDRDNGPRNQWTEWDYWWCNVKDNYFTWAAYLSFNQSGPTLWRTDWCNNWRWIRPIYNEFVQPWEDWITLLDWWGVWHDGIFRNPERWLISISDLMNCQITIADKNLWATRIYQPWDTVSQDNCWWYFQRWNCYMFPFTGPTKTEWFYNKKNADSYWAFYYGEGLWWSFITVTADSWFSHWHKNIRWFNVDPITGEERLWNDQQNRWPCQLWYRIPMRSDILNLQSVLREMWIGNWDAMQRYLKMPLWGFRSAFTWLVEERNTTWWYRTVSTPDSIHSYSYKFWDWLLDFENQEAEMNAYWYLVRPIKTTPVVPDSTRTKLY